MTTLSTVPTPPLANEIQRTPTERRALRSMDAATAKLSAGDPLSWGQFNKLIDDLASLRQEITQRAA
jgi:hypothetical protein